jgi:two-component system response regulator FixJ
MLEGLVAGPANKQIAFDLGISPWTVEIQPSQPDDEDAGRGLSELVRMALIAGILNPAPKSDTSRAPSWEEI